MEHGTTVEPMEGLTIRSYRAEDQPKVAWLYDAGLLTGQIAPNDTGADIDNIQEAYFDDPRHHLWVAEVPGGAPGATEAAGGASAAAGQAGNPGGEAAGAGGGEVVGMVAVSSDEEHTAEVRRLRVYPEYQRSPIAPALLRTAIEHCKRHGFLKVRLDTRFERDDALDMFGDVGFQHTRTRTVQGRDLLEFYLDIYRQDED